MEDEKDEIPLPFAEYTAKKDGQLTIRELMSFIGIITTEHTDLFDKPINYIFDGEYQSGFSKVIFEDMQIRLVDNG